MDEFVLIYITCEKGEEAEKIGEKLVEEKLAGCCNIIPEVTSFFFWEGEKKREEESVLVLKTRKDLVEDLTERVKSLHSYSVPEILVLPIVSGNREYLEWLGKNVK